MNRHARRAQVAQGGAGDVVMEAILRMMGDSIRKEIGPDTSFAIFIDWRDGEPRSYLSNIPRPRVLPILDEWIVRTPPTSALPFAAGTFPSEAPTLQAKCAVLGMQMVEEDVDVVLFLVTWGEAGETAWFMSLPLAVGHAVVREWVANEKKKS